MTSETPPNPQAEPGRLLRPADVRHLRLAALGPGASGPAPVPARLAPERPGGRRGIDHAEPVTSVDVTSADVLAELEQTLRASSIELHFAEMKDPVKDKLKRFELLARFGSEDFHPTLGAAVDAYLEEHAANWKP